MGSARSVQVNTRFLSHEMTGVQRYTTEILRRLSIPVDRFFPDRWPAGGIPGHLWEQTALPFLLGEGLFWNPTCPGPIAVGNQVVTVHDLTAIEHPEWFDRKYAIWNRLLTPLLLRRCRHVIAVSHYTKQRIQERYGVRSKKITVVHNGVDARFSPTDDDDIERVRKELNIPAGPYVLSLSALQPRKNLRRVLNVWGRIQEAVSGPISLVLAGGKGRPTVFNDFSIDDPPSNVHFTGYVDDDMLPALYSGAEIFAYPSLYEGFGLPVLEAMACETAVVTSNVTSLPEVAGEAAVLVDPYSEDEIERGIVELLRDDVRRTRLDRKGAKQADSFQWKETARKTEDVFRRFSE